jgi:hypothetical protein
MRSLSLAAAFMAAVFVVGCGEVGPKLIPVSGTVALTNGKVVKHGYVNFHPDPARGNSSGQVGIGYIKDGQYTLKTGDKSGVVAGWYKITVDAANETDPNNPYVTEWFAEERYTDKDRSKLEFEVVEKAEPGRYDLKLNPHPKAKK